jgi:hypothetical protein
VEFPGPSGTPSFGARTLRASSHWSGQLLVSPPQLLSGHFSLEQPATGQPAPATLKSFLPGAASYWSDHSSHTHQLLLGKFSLEWPATGQPAPATLR